MTRILSILFILTLLPLSLSAQQPNRRLGAEVKAEFMHAWNGYKKYAWGHDDLKPLSKTHHDWYPQPLLMTPVDSLDTMIIMGLDEEAATTRAYILENLSFDKDIDVQNFEITIRLLGGLITNYQLTNDKRDRKSTRLNSSHLVISYAVFCLKKKKKHKHTRKHRITNTM